MNQRYEHKRESKEQLLDSWDDFAFFSVKQVFLSLQNFSTPDIYLLVELMVINTNLVFL
ncbi:hypothetical protein [Fischerella thermalis]|uniref:hypothetical protein n=1 Tax=Fischerella thermalis TaxID=372787 RepID=UPI00307F5945